MIGRDEEFTVLDPVEQGLTLTEKAVDVHVIDGCEVIARWYHSPLSSDLMIWLAEGGTVQRFQLNSGGQILDWVEAEGLQTGLIIELEIVQGQDVAETIRFDAVLNAGTVQNAQTILQNSHRLSPEVRAFLLARVAEPALVGRKPRVHASRTRFWGRFKRWTTGA